MNKNHPELTIHQVSHKRRIVTISEPVEEGSSTSRASAVSIAAHVTMRNTISSLDPTNAVAEVRAENIVATRKNTPSAEDPSINIGLWPLTSHCVTRQNMPSADDPAKTVERAAHRRGPHTCMDLHVKIPSCRDIAYLDRMVFSPSTRPCIRTKRSSPFIKFLTKRRIVTMSKPTTGASTTTRTSTVTL